MKYFRYKKRKECWSHSCNPNCIDMLLMSAETAYLRFRKCLKTSNKFCRRSEPTIRELMSNSPWKLDASFKTHRFSSGLFGIKTFLCRLYYSRSKRFFELGLHKNSRITTVIRCSLIFQVLIFLGQFFMRLNWADEAWKINKFLIPKPSAKETAETIKLGKIETFLIIFSNCRAGISLFKSSIRFQLVPFLHLVGNCYFFSIALEDGGLKTSCRR